MADMVVEALEEPVQTVTEACVANMVENVELQPIDERLGIAGVSGVGAEGELFASVSPTLLGEGGIIGGINDSTTKGSSSKSRKQLKDGERLTARIAMFGVLVTLLVELVNGKSMVHMFGNL